MNRFSSLSKTPPQTFEYNPEADYIPGEVYLSSSESSGHLPHAWIRGADGHDYKFPFATLASGPKDDDEFVIIHKSDAPKK